MIRKIIGYTIATSPIFALLVFMAFEIGVEGAVIIVGSTAILIGVVVLGVWVAEGG